ncbi:hypothetical protein DOTSEDRAFT_30022 [Dothistroma septosporum NZE10]|uniref:Uncharacterized protein n=1 Tax=Dothistroma septosporum (strain NZE10 / CBS 128990) TaxID=675120 RepID=N1PYN7_DOTSN|nr:hypothetical protein DOTSEDRAFT_30022 [Dothistroma septosporum NZE10]
MDHYSIRTPSTRASLNTCLVKRPGSRDTTFLVGLPAAVPPRVYSIRSSRATLIDAKTGAAINVDSARPPLPPMLAKALPPHVDLDKRESQSRHWYVFTAPGTAVSWPKSRKCASTWTLVFVAFCVAFALSMLSPVRRVASHDLGIVQELSTSPSSTRIFPSLLLPTKHDTGSGAHNDPFARRPRHRVSPMVLTPRTSRAESDPSRGSQRSRSYVNSLCSCSKLAHASGLQILGGRAASSLILVTAFLADLDHSLRWNGPS